eukprot:gene17337-biopygen6788
MSVVNPGLPGCSAHISEHILYKSMSSNLKEWSPEGISGKRNQRFQKRGEIANHEAGVLNDWYRRLVSSLLRLSEFPGPPSPPCPDFGLWLRVRTRRHLRTALPGVRHREPPGQASWLAEGRCGGDRPEEAGGAVMGKGAQQARRCWCSAALGTAARHNRTRTGVAVQRWEQPPRGGGACRAGAARSVAGSTMTGGTRSEVVLRRDAQPGARTHIAGAAAATAVAAAATAAAAAAAAVGEAGSRCGARVARGHAARAAGRLNPTQAVGAVRNGCVTPVRSRGARFAVRARRPRGPSRPPRPPPRRPSKR